MAFYGHFIVFYGHSWQNIDLIELVSSFLAVIDPNLFGLIQNSDDSPCSRPTLVAFSGLGRLFTIMFKDIHNSFLFVSEQFYVLEFDYSLTFHSRKR